MEGERERDYQHFEWLRKKCHSNAIMDKSFQTRGCSITINKRVPKAIPYHLKVGSTREVFRPISLKPPEGALDHLISWRFLDWTPQNFPQWYPRLREDLGGALAGRAVEGAWSITGWGQTYTATSQFITLEAIWPLGGTDTPGGSVDIRGWV